MARNALAILLLGLTLAACTAEEIPSPEFAAQRQRFESAYQSGDYATALQAATAALEAGPALDEPYVWVSSLHSRLGQDEQGITFFADFAKKHPERAQPYFYRGRHELRSTRNEEALASFTRAAELDPDDAECPYWRGVALYSLGQFDEATLAYRRAYGMDPGAPKKAVQLVRVLRELGSYEEATKIATEAAARSPESAELHYAVGQLRLREMDLAGAESSLRLAIQLDPNHLEAHRDLAVVLLRTDREVEAQREEAVAGRIDDYEKGKRAMRAHLANTGDPAVPMLMAELELTERHFNDAIRWFGRAEVLGGGNVRTLAGLAEALFRSGDLPRGDATLTRISEAKSPRIDLARAARAIMHGDNDGAAALIASAVADGPEEREFLRRAADLYNDAGKPSKSATLLVRAMQAPRTSSAPGTM